MAYINSDLPYDKYVEKCEKRKMGRASIPNQRFGRKKLTIINSILLTPILKDGIDKLIEKGLFPNQSEFIRHLIIKFFEENKEWIR